MSIDVDAIKRSNPLPETIERLTGERIERHKIRCPFHDDRTPSLQVYDDGGWKCFGCGKFGDVIDFVGYLFHGDTYHPDAHFLEIVDRLGGLEIAPLPQRTTRPKPPAPLPRLGIDLPTVMQWSDEMPDTRRAYWHSRGLTDQTIREFFLGWDGSRYTIPALYRYQVFGIKRRQSEIDDGIAAKYTQIKGSRIGIFNADNLWEAERVIVCEGEIDCMLLHQAGYAAVTSTGGAGSWRGEWTKFFTHIRDIVILFDNDEAGRAGARKIWRTIRRARILTLPDGIQDVGDLFTQYPAPHSWLEATIQ